MKIGIHLPQIEYESSWAQQADISRSVEDEGFDSIWIADHLLYRTPDTVEAPWEAWTRLAGVAAVTSRVEIGPLVAALGFHAPAVLAKMAATVDEISEGRLVFGMGAGWNKAEFEAFGLPFDQRASRFAESFEIIRRLLAGETVTFDGEFNKLDRAVLVPRPRPGGPKLMIGSNGHRMLDVTLNHVHAWNTWCSSFGNDPDRVGTVLQQIKDACRRVGRDPSTLEKSVVLLVQVDEADRLIGEEPTIGRDPGLIADAFCTLDAAGVDHVQVVLAPITPPAVRMLARALNRYRR